MSRTPRCRVCEHPKLFCTCSALQLWQDSKDLPIPIVPFARLPPFPCVVHSYVIRWLWRRKPDGLRHEGFPHHECERGVGRRLQQPPVSRDPVRHLGTPMA